MINRSGDSRVDNLWLNLKKAEGSSIEEKLDAVVPGEWDLTFEIKNEGSPETGDYYHVKARLQILGVIREAVAVGKEPDTASEIAFAKAAGRFGVKL